MALSQYLSDDSYEWVLNDLNFADVGTDKSDEILSRAVGSLESDLAEKFVVPLLAKDGGAYSTAPQWARQMVLNTLKAKIREVIGYEKNRNLTGTIESTEKFINVHGIEYKDLIRKLLNPKVDFGFQLLPYAQDAQVPVQHLALSRPDDRTDPFATPDDEFT